MISIILSTPFISALLMLAIPRNNIRIIKTVAILSCIVVLGLSGFMVYKFDYANTAFQFTETYKWIPLAGISYSVGLDGLSLALFLLTGLMGLISVVYSLNRQKDVKSFFILLMILLSGAFGVFAALDLFLFYMFFEVALVPMYFLIGIFGGEKRYYAAIKFFLYTLFGSLSILLGILILFFNTEFHSFAYTDMMMAAQNLNQTYALIVFLCFFIGFAIKLPIFPFHTWLPLAHVEAPTAGSVLLAAILLKMGGYGFLRFLIPFFPEVGATYAGVLGVLAVISLIYGALLAMAQTDLKKMIAYSSISHMAYIMFGVSAAFSKINDFSAKAVALNGAVFQMIAHGLITGGLFLLVGMIYLRTKTRNINEMGGILKATPILAGIFIFFAFASLGLPTLAGFIGEFLTLLGFFHFYKIPAAVALVGIILTAVYFLRAIQKVFMGNLPEKFKSIKDLGVRELIVLLPLIALIILLGVYPAPMLNLIQNSFTLNLFK